MTYDALGYNAETIPDLLAPDGPLAGELTGYEDRPFQREMALEVARLLEDGGRMAIEAPTGIGKSLGYALPAAAWALQGHGPVVISTHTKALQDQLVSQEAPRLARILGPLDVALMKGRANYLCRRRYEIAVAEASGEGTQKLLEDLRPWTEITADGDFGNSGVRLGRELQFLMTRVGSEVRFCAHPACTPASGCFFKLARARAGEAHLLVVNHALLAIHLFTGRELLPTFPALVVDEAHAFVKVALDHLTLAVSPSRLASILEQAPGAKGRVPDVARFGSGADHAAVMHRSLATMDAAARSFFSASNGRKPRGDSRRRYRDADEFYALTPQGPQSLIQATNAAREEARSLADLVRRDGEGDEREEGFRHELARFQDELETFIADLKTVTEPDGHDRAHVNWKEWVGDGPFGLHRAPLEAGPKLAEALGEGPDRLVFTSATLAAGKDFSFFSREVGHADALATVAYPSPFAFERQALAVAVRSGPDPRDPGWAVATADTLARLMAAPARKTMALFTSYRDLDAVRYALEASRGPAPQAVQMGIGDAPQTQSAPQARYDLFAQGEGGTAMDLLRRFRAAPQALLLGTASFWEGVDLPGDDLEVLVLTRLPFGVPTDPRFQARSERLEAEGGNSFSSLYLPEALLRFKQGIGRLIRRASDRGILAVLDPRMVTKGYGRQFRAVLPLPLTEVRDGRELAARAAAWWDQA